MSRNFQTMNAFLSSLPSLWSAASEDEDGWENGGGEAEKLINQRRGGDGKVRLNHVKTAVEHAAPCDLLPSGHTRAHIYGSLLLETCCITLTCNRRDCHSLISCLRAVAFIYFPFGLMICFYLLETHWPNSHIPGYSCTTMKWVFFTYCDGFG